MIFATTCFGEDRREDTLHFLNDIRNLDYSVYVITNIELHLNHFQFDNVIIIKVDENYYQDFFRYKLMLEIFETTDEEIIYYLDSDSRFFNFRHEKFDKENFDKLIESKDFDILTAWLTDSVSLFFEKPEDNENKFIRQFKYGYESLHQYMSNKYPDYINHLNLHNSWEGHLILRKSDNLIEFLKELIIIGDILVVEDIKNDRTQIACCSSALISLMSKLMNLKLIQDPITHHFFKANFLKEVFPFNFKINKYEKVFPDNN